MHIGKVTAITHKLFILFTLVTSLNSTLTGQDLSEVFDDGGLSQRKNLIKINIVPLFQGELTFNYERILTDHITAEVGLGFQLPYYMPDIGMFLNDGSATIEKPAFSVQWWLFPKYYFQAAPEMGFVGVILRQRKYDTNENDYNITDIMYSYGIQMFKGDKMLIEFNIAIGYRLQKNQTVKLKKEGVAIGYGMKVGYCF